jgi:hypothetical protein
MLTSSASIALHVRPHTSTPGESVVGEIGVERKGALKFGGGVVMAL